jgi:hypothetical protein|tara:strand:- start:147 stop:1010 length:864 start_codon:yes stop_codon:yes gene_type:complete
MAVNIDPIGLYGDDPDYEDWAKDSFGKQMNLGFIYENKLFSQYKDVGLVPSGFTPAGADSTAADLELWTGKYASRNQTPKTGSKIKIEVKLDPNADYGQASLKHNGSSWVLSGKSTAEALEMRKLLNNMNVVSEINKAWPGQPNLFKYANSNLVPAAEKAYDQETFRSSYISGSGFARTFSSYYSSKGVHYIQIGGYGLYSLNQDPNGLKNLGVTSFLQSGASMKLRIRVKGSKSKGTYRFSTALLMDKPPRRSGFDLDDEGALETLRWDAVECNNAPYQLKNQSLG